ncbi:MAG: phage integrase N-terminal SAM-like domain-containing protein, partial [Nitrospirota bacterium]|nr:phage integrase N-terminal SAM-like domain-containing protein [Nitrospirota bacterium]
MITVNKDISGGITVSFQYDPQLVAKVKTIEGRKWHKDKKYWSFPNTDGTIEKILEVFKGEEIHIDPALQAELSSSSISYSPTLAKPSYFPPLEKGGEGGFSDKNNPTIVLEHNFEDLRRELVSRKYSYKTVKGYIYYNRDFLSFIKKETADVRESDIKDYLVYLAEEKESATATLN